MNQSNKCSGVNKQGKPCGAIRLSDVSKRSHLTTTEAWYCHRHKDQAP